jgi:hypothetical protein
MGKVATKAMRIARGTALTMVVAVMLVAGVASGAFAKGQPLYTCEWTIGGTHSIGNVIPKDKAYYERTFEAVCVRQ